MSGVIKFYGKTINKVSEEIEKTKTELNTKLDTNECNEIFLKLEKNGKLNRKHLQERKVKKSNYLILNPNTNHEQKKMNKSCNVKENQKKNIRHQSYGAILK